MSNFVVYGYGRKLLETKAPQMVLDELGGYISHARIKWYYETANDAWNALNRAPDGVVLLGVDFRRNCLWTLIRTVST